MSDTADLTDELSKTVTDLVGDQAGAWDRAGLLPDDLLRKCSASGVLCAEVPREYGGHGLSSSAGGEFTAHVGSLCSSLRSVMTSQGMAAWSIQRLGTASQRSALLPRLTSGELAAVAFSEPDAGSDLNGITTTIRAEGEHVVIDGRKKWITVGRYADLLVVFGRYGDGAAAVVVPRDTPGVRVEPVADPLGCRAAGHANIEFRAARVPADHVLGGPGQSLPMLVTAALTYGRISVAWGCVGILRACLRAAARHTTSRRQFGRKLAEHQLVAGHLADLVVAEQIATQACAEASRARDEGAPEMFVKAVAAKHIGATHAARASATTVQLLASAGAEDGAVAARAYRDAKLMEIIEGTNEICQLILADHAVAEWA
ncbi:acyl-CoA/acyl-ACP dehydrogenase (plasmid) [Streptomyces sp. NBC_01450]|jgi:methoxymalonate biosynthesis protein|uniref:acyl-CoA dehydrogenase family protein n=1 Tax=Streptomyces sp. NBC_01450 TaxID=2903871 RepID=UPI002E36C912|nr:acyl-CoA dehydrogenase family protein [Streptomyces sp. NBC_01450]